MKKYKIAAKRLKSLISIEHQQNELKIINSNDLGNFYKFMNKRSDHKTGIGPLEAPSWLLVGLLEDKEKAQILNDYFVSICTTDDGVLPPLPDPDLCSPALDNITFYVTQLFRILKKVKKKLSSGPDGIPSILFSHLASQLAYPLSLIYNLII